MHVVVVVVSPRHHQTPLSSHFHRRRVHVANTLAGPQLWRHMWTTTQGLPHRPRNATRSRCLLVAICFRLPKDDARSHHAVRYKFRLFGNQHQSLGWTMPSLVELGWESCMWKVVSSSDTMRIQAKKGKSWQKSAVEGSMQNWKNSNSEQKSRNIFQNRCVPTHTHQRSDPIAVFPRTHQRSDPIADFPHTHTHVNAAIQSLCSHTHTPSDQIAVFFSWSEIISNAAI